MKKILLLLLAINCSALAQGIDQQQTNSDGYYDLSPGNAFGQTFTAGTSGYLCAVTVKLRYYTTAPQNVVMEIFNTSGSYSPVLDQVLASSSLTITDQAPADYTFTFNVPAEVVSGTRYAFAIRGSDESFTGIHYARDMRNPYTAGHGFGVFPNFLGISQTTDTYFVTQVCSSSLPVQLVTFGAREVEDRVALNWQTSAESNSSHFEVYRSVDAREFDLIGKVKSSGQSLTDQDYEFTDNVPSYVAGKIYYRLRSVDVDGSFSDSKIITLKRDAANAGPGIYPNPVISGRCITVDYPLHTDLVSMTNAAGRHFCVKVTGRTATTAELDLGNVPSGIYLIQIPDGNAVFIKRVVVQ